MFFVIANAVIMFQVVKYHSQEKNELVAWLCLGIAIWVISYALLGSVHSSGFVFWACIALRCVFRKLPEDVVNPPGAIQRRSKQKS